MSHCRLCESFREETRTDGTGKWCCDNEAVTYKAFTDQLMDDAPDCASFYPGEHQTVYQLGAGEWEHQCDRMPTSAELLWDNKCWYLWSSIDEPIQPLFCPWCGTELLPMPEVRE